MIDFYRFETKNLQRPLLRPKTYRNHILNKFLDICFYNFIGLGILHWFHKKKICHAHFNDHKQAILLKNVLIFLFPEPKAYNHGVHICA